jgi:hypothetical protein
LFCQLKKSIHYKLYWGGAYVHRKEF